jgi:hypothetical protein
MKSVENHNDTHNRGKNNNCPLSCEVTGVCECKLHDNHSTDAGKIHLYNYKVSIFSATSTILSQIYK